MVEFELRMGSRYSNTPVMLLWWLFIVVGRIVILIPRARRSRMSCTKGRGLKGFRASRDKKGRKVKDKVSSKLQPSADCKNIACMHCFIILQNHVRPFVYRTFLSSLRSPSEAST